jgi:hypothetical protein
VLPDLGSDHFGISFTITGSNQQLVDSPTQLASYNTELANWELFSSTLQAGLTSYIALNSPELRSSSSTSLAILKNQDSRITRLLDSATDELTSLITKAADLSIPKRKLGGKPKA